MGKRLSAGVVVVRRNEERERMDETEGNEGWLFLLLRAYKNWDFPKGIVEAGEEPLTAAIRETREESSIEDLDFCYGEAFRETEPYAGGKVARYYLARTRTGELTLPVNPELGRPEHHEYRWCPPEEARQLLPERLLPILVWALEQLPP